MNPEFLKQAELFIFLSAFFLIGIMLTQKEQREQNEHQENPPIIILSEENKIYRFPFGSARVSIDFKEALQNRIIPRLDSLSRVFSCDIIEVVGHTDGVRNSRPSNLDDHLLDSFYAGKIGDLESGSNLDLGMMRALAIVKILKESRNSGALDKIRFFFPYSAGQMILLNGGLAKENTKKPERERRRIEIRLTKSSTRRIR